MSKLPKLPAPTSGFGANARGSAINAITRVVCAAVLVAASACESEVDDDVVVPIDDKADIDQKFDMGTLFLISCEWELCQFEFTLSGDVPPGLAFASGTAASVRDLRQFNFGKEKEGLQLCEGCTNFPLTVPRGDHVGAFFPNVHSPGYDEDQWSLEMGVNMRELIPFELAQPMPMTAEGKYRAKGTAHRSPDFWSIPIAGNPTVHVTLAQDFNSLDVAAYYLCDGEEKVRAVPRVEDLRLIIFDRDIDCPGIFSQKGQFLLKVGARTKDTDYEVDVDTF